MKGEVGSRYYSVQCWRGEIGAVATNRLRGKIRGRGLPPWVKIKVEIG
jgi:hypothetical protein